MEYKMHEAEAWLRDENNPMRLRVKVWGENRTLFINRSEGGIGILAKGKRSRGWLFSAWDKIEKIYYPKSETEADVNRRLVNKYKRLAATASFENEFIRAIRAADPAKPPYENKITTGTRIDGQVIKLDTIAKYDDWVVERFKAALAAREEYGSCRFDFRGYDGRLWCEPRENGDFIAGFSKEYRNCGNGYYYLLINDDTFIGYDID